MPAFGRDWYADEAQGLSYLCIRLCVCANRNGVVLPIGNIHRGVPMRSQGIGRLGLVEREGCRAADSFALCAEALMASAVLATSAVTALVSTVIELSRVHTIGSLVVG